MTTSQISLLALILVGGIGILLIGVSALMKAVARKKAKACTAVTMGTVIEHRFMGEGRMYPVLEYAVDGTQYRAKKQFRGIKTKSLSGLPIRTQATAYEDAKGWLHVQTGPIARLGTLAEQLWPLGSQMTVYYNPSNPDKSYVERPIVGNFATLMFNIAGFLLITMSILLSYDPIHCQGPQWPRRPLAIGRRGLPLNPSRSAPGMSSTPSAQSHIRGYRSGGPQSSPSAGFP